MEFHSVKQLLERFSALGATRVFCKRLAENDNSKQQIYLGGNFDVLSFFPFGEVREFPDLAQPNFKASLNLFWINGDSAEQAPDAQLILYPKYPEVRLSGFLRGCSIAPREHMQPIPASERSGNDGRILIFGTTADRRLLAYLASTNSTVAGELAKQLAAPPEKGVFHELTVAIGSASNRAQLLSKLREIHLAGFHSSLIFDKRGVLKPSTAPNAGGLTLEALLGIRPNSKSEPDYLGWEVKGYGGDKITLMTPEPNGGFYAANGVAQFVRHFGYVSPTKVDRLDFTGTHYVNVQNSRSELALRISGFDAASKTITDVGGSLDLVDAQGVAAATWTFGKLLEHWNRKHAFAVYVPYVRQDIPRAFNYKSPVLLAEGTDFPKFLSALCNQHVIHDPGCKVEAASSAKPKAKARNQFRISLKRLNVLYDRIEPVDL